MIDYKNNGLPFPQIEKNQRGWSWYYNRTSSGSKTLASALLDTVQGGHLYQALKAVPRFVIVNGRKMATQEAVREMRDGWQKDALTKYTVVA